jgi:hypothetical protein
MSEAPALRLEGIEKVYNAGKTQRGAGVARRIGRDRGGRGRGPRGAVGGGKVDASAYRGAAGHGGCGHGGAGWLGDDAAPRTGRARRRGGGRWGSSTSSTICCRSSGAGERGAAATGPWRGADVAAGSGRRCFWIGSGWRIAARIAPPSCPAGSSSASRSAGRWPMRRGSCWPMSRRATSTPRPRTGCSTCSLALVRDTGMAALIATHNPSLAARMDRVLAAGAGSAGLRPGAIVRTNNPWGRCPRAFRRSPGVFCQDEGRAGLRNGPRNGRGWP